MEITHKITGSDFKISNHRYKVRLACNAKEVDEALKLRFEVFARELKLEHAYRDGRDEDIYDAQFDHLLVFHKADDLIVGTYRMQTEEMAKQGRGFVAATEFDLSGFSENFLHNAIEIGRSCIAKPHRKGWVLHLMWKGLAHYSALKQKRFLFGCCSLNSQDINEGYQLQRYLEENGYMHPGIHINPRKDFICHPDNPVEDWQKVKPPDLLRLYLQLGAKVCGPPAIDRSYKTIDFMIVLDVKTPDKKIVEKYYL
jgi:putative hemolysin